MAGFSREFQNWAVSPEPRGPEPSWRPLLLFGVIHAYQGISRVFATGLSWLVFGSVYLATGRNLWAPIVAHGIMDTTGLVMIYLGVYPGL